MNKVNTRRGPKTKDFLVKEIILLKKDDPSLPASEIRGKLVESHPGSKFIPKERAIYKILERNKSKTEPSQLDEPWSIGGSVEHGIPVDEIKYLIPVQKRLAENGLFLTFRRAKWLSILRPLLAPSLDRIYPKQAIESEVTLYQISSFYTRASQLAEIDNKKYSDTSELDKIFIIDQDVSFPSYMRQWWTLYYPQADLEAVQKDKKPTFTVERVVGDLDNEQSRLLGQFKDLLLLSITDEGKQKNVIDFTTKYPQVIPLAKTWLAFMRRRDLYDLWQAKNQKDGEAK